jgi:hypothetical protein
MKLTSQSLLLVSGSVYTLAVGSHGFSRTTHRAETKAVLIENLISRMKVQDLVQQLHLTFADNIVGPASDNSLYDFEMRFTPGSAIGHTHDWFVYVQV